MLFLEDSFNWKKNSTYKRRSTVVIELLMALDISILKSAADCFDKFHIQIHKRFSFTLLQLCQYWVQFSQVDMHSSASPQAILHHPSLDDGNVGWHVGRALLNSAHGVTASWASSSAAGKIRVLCELALRNPSWLEFFYPSARELAQSTAHWSTTRENLSSYT